MTHPVTLRLCQLLVFLTCLALISSRVLTYADCLKSGRLDSICYECAKRFPSLHNEVYMWCCGDDLEMRRYCNNTYPENAQVGGLWL